MEGLRAPGGGGRLSWGSPIAHSLSPVLHRAAYGQLGLDWTYDAIEVDEAGSARLPGSLRAGMGGACR